MIFGGLFIDLNSSGGLNGSNFITNGLSSGLYTIRYLVGDGVTCPLDSTDIDISLTEGPSYRLSNTIFNICEDFCDSLTINFSGTPPFSFPFELTNVNDPSQSIDTLLNVADTSITFLLCNSGNGTFEFSNDTLSLPSNNAWHALISSIGDQNCESFITNSDSIFITTLSFNTFQLDTTACISDTLSFGNIRLFASNPTYIDTIQGTICDSIINIRVNFTNSDTIRLQPELCLGDSIQIRGVWYSEMNPSDQFTVSSTAGCDSVFIINVDLLMPVVDSIQQSLCNSESIEVNGTTYDVNNPNGIEILENQSMNGCDSIVVINLNFTSNVEILIQETLCPGEFRIIEGVRFDESMPSDSLILSNGGCDSLIIVDLSFQIPAIGEISGTYCSDFNIEINGRNYNKDNPQGVETLTNQSVNGCDSLVTIDLSFFDDAISFETITICANDSILINNTIYNLANPSGTELIAGGSLNGCDSTINVQLIFSEVFDNIDNVTLCEGDSILVGGQWQFNEGIYIDSFVTDNFCDSIVTTIVQLEPCDFIVMTDVINNTCAGDSSAKILISIGSTFIDDITVIWELVGQGIIGQRTIASGTSDIEIEDLKEGNYSISIVDQTGAVIWTGSVDLQDENSPIEATWAVEAPILCNGDSNGSIRISISGGATPYDFLWSEPTIGNTMTSGPIGAGNYEVLVTDALGCSVEFSYLLEEPESISAIVTTTNTSCSTADDGSISVNSISGGTAPYTILLDGNPINENQIVNLPSGMYQLSIADANNCLNQFFEEILAQPDPNLATYQTSYTINQGDTLDIELLSSNSNLIFSWISNEASLDCNDCPEPRAYPTTDTEYELLVEDLNGCTQLIIISVNVIKEVKDNVYSEAFSPDGGTENNTFIFIAPSSDVSSLALTIYDRWGSLISSSNTNGNSITWDGKLNGTTVNSGVYVFVTKIIKIDGTIDVQTGNVLVVR